MIVCKFSHLCSLMIDGERGIVVGDGGHVGVLFESFRLDRYSAPAVAAVNVNECLVHVYLADSSILEISSSQDRGLTIRVLRV